MQEMAIARPIKLYRAVDSELELDKYWDRKLSQKFALAPRIIQAGYSKEMTEELYDNYNRDFDNHCSDFVRKELSIMQMQKLDLEGKTICVLGPGLGRGLRFASFANRDLKMTIKLYDVSRRAVTMTNAVLKAKEIRRKSLATIKELTGADGEIPEGTKLIVMSQFLQILSRERMTSIMRMIARYTEQNPDCRTIIIHRFETDDNPQFRGDTTPYTPYEILSPTREVIGTAMEIIRVEPITYFGIHTYQAITLAKP